MFSPVGPGLRAMSFARSNIRSKSNNDDMAAAMFDFDLRNGGLAWSKIFHNGRIFK